MAGSRADIDYFGLPNVVGIPDGSLRRPVFTANDRHPATCINRDEGLEYLKWLSQKTGRDCRVGQYQPNAWGIHDTAGNVQEMVEDCLHDNYESALADGSACIEPDCQVFVARGGDWSTW